jgi:hypothetical protein
MKPSILAVVLLMLVLSPSFGQEPGLEFLSNIPELRDLSLKMSEDQFKSHIEKHRLYAKRELQQERVTYWVLTRAGENVSVGFVFGKCTGIQRMQPIPKQLIKNEIGASEYRGWMAKRKAESFFLVSAGLVGAAETNGFLVFEVERLTYNGRTNESNIKQSVKVPLTEEFMSNFKHAPSQNSSGTGFCCAGGNLKTSAGSTRFIWWIRKTADNRWAINLWGEGVETIRGVTVSSWNPKTSQTLTIKTWEDLDMSYMLSYGGALSPSGGNMNISFTVKYVTAKDIDADGPIPSAPVQKADHSQLFKGDDLSNLPLEISCLFQEG